MKLFLILTLSFSLSSFVNATAQKVTVDAKNATFKTVIQAVQIQTGYSFIIRNEFFLKAQPVTLKVAEKNLMDVLPLLFENQPFGYVVKGKVVSAVALPAKKNVEKITDRFMIDTIRGRIIYENGEPVAGATVMVKGTKNATATTDDGVFVLNAVDEFATLLISGVNIEGYEFKLNGQTDIGTIKARLKVDRSDEIVLNTGYQQIPKERATGSFSFIDNKLLNQRVSSNIVDRLEGNVSGLIFHKNTSQSDDDGIDINIRGHSTLFANDQPLIVLDNFPYDGPLSNINPNDIEQISILKDAAAASIWGAKSGNGVIVITSKKGSLNSAVKVEFNANSTFGEKPNVFYKPSSRIASTDRIDIQTMLYKQGYYSNALSNTTSYPAIPLVVSILDKVDKALISVEEASKEFEKLSSNDMRNDLQKHFYQPTINQQYAINLQGGGLKNDYYVSVGYDNNRPSKVGFQNNRFNLSSNLNIYISNKFTFSTQVNFTLSKNKTNSVLSELNSLMTSGLLSEYTDLVDDKTGKALSIIKDRNPIYLEDLDVSELKDWYYRPYDEIKFAENKQNQLHNRLNLGLKYKILQGVEASLKYQFEKGSTEIMDYRSPETYYVRNLINRFYDPNGIEPYPVPSDGGVLNSINSNLNSHRGRFQINYNKYWSQEHDLSLLFASEINETANESHSNTMYGYNPENLTFSIVDFINAFPTNPDGWQQIPNNIGSGKYSDRYISYLVNGSYSYLNKYILSFSGRIDKSNLFGVKTNQKAAPLYSLGFAWDMSNEKFYDFNFISYSRVRATYGYSGNIDKSTSAYNQFMAANNALLYGLPFAVIVRAGNPELRWEKIRTINLGYDFRSKNDRLSGNIDFYFKKGIDLFGYSPLPGSTGFTVFYGNTASTSTKGFDINLNSINISTADFNWKSNLMISKALDIIIDYKVEEHPASYITGMRSSSITPLVGKPLYAVYSYRWAGLSAENGDPQGYLDGEVSNDWSSILSNTTIENMVYNGPARPVHFGSLRNTFTYKKISFSANIIYKLGYYFRRSSITDAGIYAGAGHSDYYKRWQKPGDEATTNVPSMQLLPTSEGRATFYQYSETLIEKGDHIRLQDISISYTIQPNNMIRFNSLQLYVTVNNVGILWKANKHDIDPDVYAGSLPNIRLYSLGAKILF